MRPEEATLRFRLRLHAEFHLATDSKISGSGRTREAAGTTADKAIILSMFALSSPILEEVSMALYRTSCTVGI